MNNADLLEKLDMIREAVERNPEWWQELEFRYYNSDWCSYDDPAQKALFEHSPQMMVFKHAIYGRPEIRLKPQRVKVEGWVDAEIYEWAKHIQDIGAYDCIEHRAAQALLKLVKEEGDGAGTG